MPCHPKNIENKGSCRYEKGKYVGFLYTSFFIAGGYDGKELKLCRLLKSVGILYCVKNTDTWQPFSGSNFYKL